MSTSHSHLGASSAERWIACPKSVWYARNTDKAPSSVFAAEGTAAHSLAEWCLILDVDANVFLGRPFRVEGFLFEVDEDMIVAVQVYLDHVRHLLKTEVKCPDPIWHIEYKCDLSWLRRGMFGTTDCMIFDGDTIWVLDYKHGQGIPVEVKGNPQFRYYALAPARDCPGAKEVVLTVVQPRADHPGGPIRSETLAVKDLMAWAHTVLGPAADRANAKNPEAHAGDHCRWCSGLAVCPTARDRAQEQACLDFEVIPAEGEGARDLVPVDPKLLSRILKIRPFVNSYLAAVEGLVMSMLARGEVVPGWKRVHGKTNRRWVDEGKTGVFLELEGLPAEKLWTTKLESPRKVETLVKAQPWAKGLKQEVLRELKGQWEKPLGQPALVAADAPGEILGPDDVPDVPAGEFTVIED